MADANKVVGPILGHVIVCGTDPATGKSYPLQVDKTTGLLTQGGGGGGGGGAVTVADGADVAQGAKADSAWVSGDGTVIAITKGLFGKAEAIRALLAGTLIVNGSGVTQPISAASLPLPTGAATSAKQDSQITLLGGGLPSALATDRLKVDGSGVTQPISAASLPLPTGAATAAKQPALGTAGSASADVLSVQGVASMTALKVDGSAVTQPISAAALPLPSGAATSAKQDTLDTDFNAVTGAAADAVVAAGATGSISAKLRRTTQGLEDLKSLIVLAAGSAVIGKTGVDQTTPGTTNRVQAGGTPVTITTNLVRPGDTTAYAAGDSVATSTSAPTVITFTSAARASGAGGVILDATLVDESNPSVVGSFELWLFDTTFTPTNDNSVLALSTTIMRTLVAVIPFTTAYADGTTTQVYHSDRRNIEFVTAGSANLFGCLVARNAYTPANAGRFDIRLLIEQD